VASRILTANAPPIFMSRNYLNRGALENADISVLQDGGATGSSAFLHRLYDMTRSSYWASLGSNDSKQEVITAGLYTGAAKVNLAFDFVAVLGHNLASWKLQYKPTAGSFTDLPALDFTGTPDTQTDTFASLAAAVNAEDIRIIANTVQGGGGGEKQIAEIIIALTSFQPDKAPYRYDRSYQDNVKTIKMADGSLDFTHIFRSDDSAEFWRAALGWRAISQAQRDLFRLEKKRVAPFIFYPEPGTIPGDIFLVRIRPDSYRDGYMSLNRDAGYEIEMELEEVGGG